MPPHLHWLKETNESELSGGVQSGKDVLLSGDGYDAIPSEFAIQRRFGRLLRKYREKRNLPITAPVGQPLRIRTGDEDGQVKAGPLTLRTPGRRLKWRLFFEDGNGNNSEELHVSRLGELQSLGLTILGTGLRIDFRTTAAVDPLVHLSVLTPWATGEDDMRPYLVEMASDVREEGEDAEETAASLTEYLGDYLPTEQPPHWQFEFDQTEFELDEGESAHFSLHVDTPTPGAALFAVQMTAEIEGKKAMVASDPLVARMPEGGSQGAELLGDDNLSGDDSEEEESEQAREVATSY
jgi:hypothetical protein